MFVGWLSDYPTLSSWYESYNSELTLIINYFKRQDKKNGLIIVEITVNKYIYKARLYTII